MDLSLLNSLTEAKTLAGQENLNLGTVPTGSYALNKVISGQYQEGIPIGAITQFYGESSTAKTVFVTHILREAQKKGYYTLLIDSENAYNEEFAKSLGLDSNKLLYAAPDTLEECFATMEKIIIQIREKDKKTPIIIGYDSIATSPTIDEITIEKKETVSNKYETHNMEGAMRAKITGASIKKFNSLLRKHKVALVIVNQIRSKVGIIYGNPETKAAGGRSLPFYLGVDNKTVSNKTSDLVKDENDEVIGIVGKVLNKKNKYAFPFRECEFRLEFNKGLDPYYGLFESFRKEGLTDIPSQGWRGLKNTDIRFRESEFVDLLLTDPRKEFQELRNLIGLKEN